MVRQVRLFAAGAIVSLLAACSTHMVPLAYVPSNGDIDRVQAPATVRVGRFDDDRGTPSNWLGAIRGGYGNPLKKLYTDKPTRNVVADAFREALRQRGLLREDSATYELQGTIRKLDCSYYFNREAHAHLTIRLVRLPSSELIYSNSYREDQTEAGVGAGIFGNVEHLRGFAEATLSRTIDQVFADPGFRRALGEGEGAMRSAPH